MGHRNGTGRLSQFRPLISKFDYGLLFDTHLETCASQILNEGDLDYCIHKLASLLVDRIGENYQNLSMCSSAMEHAKLEWYRKRVAPYEELKITENGDI